jgi:hypothetical protein
MDPLGIYAVSRRVIVYEIVGFALVVAAIWLDEVIDIPHLLFGAEASRVNWQEALFESVLLAILGGAVTLLTYRILRRMKHLEGILPICAACKRIRDDTGNWNTVESYISKEAGVDFSHGICPECARRLYPDYFKEKEN